MSEKSVKADRRTIRRAFGDEALATVRQQHEDIKQLIAHVASLAKRLEAFQTMSRWQRLRWVLGL